MSRRYYYDYDEAARNSFTKKAISKESKQVETSKGFRMIRIVKPLYRQPHAVYMTAPGMRCSEYSVSYREVDQVEQWEAF
ncbi:MAG: hypothetical protein JXK93_11500 [Sphaerochaetaceae bacterium]|nr:hypothetical protein [Sphaerochaetaceae bacterium]